VNNIKFITDQNKNEIKALVQNVFLRNLMIFILLESLGLYLYTPQWYEKLFITAAVLIYIFINVRILSRINNGKLTPRDKRFISRTIKH